MPPGCSGCTGIFPDDCSQSRRLRRLCEIAVLPCRHDAAGGKASATTAKQLCLPPRTPLTNEWPAHHAAPQGSPELGSAAGGAGEAPFTAAASGARSISPASSPASITNANVRNSASHARGKL